MELTTTTTDRTPARRAAVNALAFVGFIVLLILGIWLAVYVARYVPKVATRIGGAAVSLSSVFHHADEDASLQVVTSTTTLPIISEATTTPAATTTASASHTGTGTAGSGSAGGYVTTVTTVKTTAIDPYGEPDLSVRITDVGYLREDGDTSSFVSSSYVPDDKDGAVKFTVTNGGTNVSGRWDFEVDVPTSPSQTYDSPTQNSLNPGDSVDYVLGFEDGREGDDRDITVTVDPDRDIHEMNENNNEASREIDIRD